MGIIHYKSNSSINQVKKSDYENAQRIRKFKYIQLD